MFHPQPILQRVRPNASCPKFALAITLFGACLACSADENDGSDPASRGGSGTSGGAGGGTACPSRGVARIEVRVSGLPAGVDAEIVVGGPVEAFGISGDRTLDVASGSYVFTPARVAAADPIVRTVFEPVLEPRALCLGEGQTHVVELSYVPVPTSHKLWTLAQNGDADVLAFDAAELASSAELEPVTSIVAGAGKDVTFDKQGNLWSMGAAEPQLMRFPLASTRQGDAAPPPDRSIDIEGIACLPALRAFAFDRGSLWVSTCGNGVVALSAEDLSASASVTPSITLGGTSDNGDLAFDMSRNLWVTAGGEVLRYDAERLEASVDTADLALSIRDAADERDITPSNLAFDRLGNLWIIDLGGNLLAQVASEALAGSGEQRVVASTTLALGVTALLERPAFDESGGLWIALDQNRFGRLSPEQLGMSTGPGEPTEPETIITSLGMGNAHRMAVYPAPEDLPLYHRFP